MALYLVQHGKALSTKADPDPGLSSEGMAAVERIAGVAAGYNVQVSRIEHSPKKRARETAELQAAQLKPAGGVVERDGIKAMDDVATVAQSANPATHVMLVGHLPFMERLTGQLIVDDPEKRVFRFQKGGIVCLDAQDGQWFVKWALMPNVG